MITSPVAPFPVAPGGAARLRVAVVGGGQNSEHDVSIASAAAVSRALTAAGHEVVPLTIDRDGLWREREQRPVGLAGAVHALRSCDVVIPMLHGPRGEDGTLAALCELAGVIYVGCGVAAAAIAMDKWATKAAANAAGIRTAPAVLLTPRDVDGYEWTHPVVVKPVAAGSSHGVSLVETAQELPAALEAAFAHDVRVLVEDVVVGREIDIAVLGGPTRQTVTLPSAEIVVRPEVGVFDLVAKYDGSADIRIPAQLDETERCLLEDAAVTLYEALGCTGVVRVDFFLTDEGAVLNEINTTPGFTEESQVPRMFAAAGLSLPQVMDLLVREAGGVAAWADSRPA